MINYDSYVTGFTEGEGCFQISFSKRSKMKWGIEVRPSFSVSQHKRGKEVIFFLQSYFKCGGVRFSKNDQNYIFEVRGIDDLMKKIIPHFKKYGFITSAKQTQFEKFQTICQIIYSKRHLNKDGLLEVIELSSNLNVTGNKKFNRFDLLKMVSKMKV